MNYAKEECKQARSGACIVPQNWSKRTI
jgi:hypothetical protein